MHAHSPNAIDVEEVVAAIENCILEVQDNATEATLRLLVTVHKRAYEDAHGHSIAGDADVYAHAINHGPFGRPLGGVIDARFPRWLQGAELSLIRRVAQANRSRSS
jgi:hypothetical protein